MTTPNWEELERQILAGISASELLKMWKRFEEQKTCTNELTAAGTNYAFEQFWKVFPHRAGDAKKPAREKFERLVKSGIDPSSIIAGATKYANGDALKLDRQYIPMASTWLNQHRFKDLAHPLSTAGIGQQDQHWEAWLTTYKNTGHWSKYAGPDPRSPACRCPKELLIKHGIAA